MVAGPARSEGRVPGHLVRGLRASACGPVTLAIGTRASNTGPAPEPIDQIGAQTQVMSPSTISDHGLISLGVRGLRWS